MFRHSKSVMSMTFVCLGIAKLECQISKAKISQLLLNMIASVYSRRCGSYMMYLEGDSPHQAVMIVCELKRFSHILNRHNMYTFMQFCDVFHT